MAKRPPSDLVQRLALIRSHKARAANVAAEVSRRYERAKEEERKLEEWRRNPPAVMTTVVVSTGRIIRYTIPPADQAKRKAMDKDRGRQLLRRRALSRQRVQQRRAEEERAFLRRLDDLGI